jgi:hypothetical protein
MRTTVRSAVASESEELCRPEMICARFFSRPGVYTRAWLTALVTLVCRSRPSTLSCVPSRSLSEYGIAVKFATGSRAGWYFFQAPFISLMVFWTSSPPPKPPMLTPPPASRVAVAELNCCVARFSCSMESRTKPRARKRSWIELSAACMRDGCCCSSPMVRTAVLLSTRRPAKYQAGASTPTRNARARMPTATHTARAPCMRDEMVFPVFFTVLAVTAVTLHHSGLNTMRWTASRDSVQSNSSKRADSMASTAAASNTPAGSLVSTRTRSVRPSGVT